MGRPTEHKTDPNETTPTSTPLTTKGPPESPLQAPTRPDPEVQMCWSAMELPNVFWQTELVRTCNCTVFNSSAMAVLRSLVLPGICANLDHQLRDAGFQNPPHPDKTAVDPAKVPELAGARATAEIPADPTGIAEALRSAISNWRLWRSHWACTTRPSEARRT